MPSLREFDRKAADQPDNAGFGGGIVHVLVPAIGDAHDRGQADDRSLLAGAHAGQGGADDAKDALQVDVEGLVPFVVGQLRAAPLGDAGIGDDDVDARRGLFDGGDQRIRPGRSSVTSRARNSPLPPASPIAAVARPPSPECR
jgi:hypothetical protein